MRLKWNRKLSILVLIMFITVTFASFNTNLFIDGKAYVRVDELVRITNIELVENTNQAYETYDPEYSKDTITINSNLPKQDSTSQYRITITNNSDYDYDVQDIVEQTYSNTNISYEITGLTVDETVLEAHTTSTFLLTLSNNTTITEEPDVYETKTYEFDYTGGEQEFTVPYTGDYTLEVWGAQGATSTTTYNSNVYLGGYGGYSKGTIHLKQNEKIYINVGGMGESKIGSTKVCKGGYNGGGDSNSYYESFSSCGSGGGATHIAKAKGQLKNLEQFKGTLVNDEYYNSKIIYIVAGGGGGGAFTNTVNNGSGGHAGGFIGGTAICTGRDSLGNGYGTGGTQTAGGYRYSDKNGQNRIGSFGLGYSDSTHTLGLTNPSGGGGGFFGGGGTYVNASGGGSGYIGSELLTNKLMYCYDCEESESVNTKTITTENHSQEPIPNYAKEGNGYAKLTITRKIEDGSNYEFDYTGGEQTFTAPYTGIYKLETWGAQGGYGYTPELYRGGYGGYSSGNINLQKRSLLYINNGGQGSSGCLKYKCDGGYNGGGKSGFYNLDSQNYNGGGGGATHIATESGLLKDLVDNKEKVIIVSGGGGGTIYRTQAKDGTYGGDGGGYIGKPGLRNGTNLFGTGGTQTEGGTSLSGDTGGFGYGGENGGNCGGAGGGYYGGGHCGGGGSGYIGSPLLYNKKMYCYDCEESNEEQTKTITTLSHSKDPKQNIAKEGNGYSRITLIKRLSNSIELSLKFNLQKLTDYSINYELDGGTISGEKSTYTRNTDNYTLPTPTKVGYNFVGWSGGKSIFSYDYILNKQVNGTGGTTYTSGKRGLFEVKPNTYYTLSTNLPNRSDGGKYVLLKSSDDVNDEIYSGRDGASAGYPITVKSTNEGHILISYFKNLMSSDMITKLNSGDYWFQIEEGNKNTAYEAYISSPQSITITKGSRGNRTYKAVWEPINYSIEYDLDGGTLSSQITTYNAETETFTIPNPTKEGYTFKGWTGGKNLLEIKNTNRTVSGVTFTINNDKSITFNGTSTYNEGHAAGRSLYIMNREVNSNVPTILLKGGRGYTINGGVWDDYRIECFQTGTSGAIYFKSYRYLSEDTLTSCYIAIEGNKTFNNKTYYPQLEWGTEQTPYEPYISTPDDNISIKKGSLGNRIYHANWEPIQSEVTLNPNGGEVSSNTITVSYDSTYSNLPTPTRDGYTFTGWKLIPNELTSTEYIETNSEGYVNTGYYVNDSTEYEISAQLLDGQAKDGCLFGSREKAGSSDGYVLWHNNIRGDHLECTSPVFAGVQKGATADVEYETFIKHKMELRNKKFYLDGVEKYTFTTAFPETNNYPLYLFTVNNGGTADARKYRGKLYYFQLIENGNTVRYYVPVVRKSDSVKGVYDLVNGRFFTLSNTYEDYPTTTIDNNTVVTKTTNHTLIATWSKNS